MSCKTARLQCTEHVPRKQVTKKKKENLLGLKFIFVDVIMKWPVNLRAKGRLLVINGTFS